MTTLFTIGYQGKPLAKLITQLRAEDVDAVVDIRLRNTSHLAGYTKRDDLGFLLREGFGIAYEHHLELAPTPELLDAYRSDGDWMAYERGFLPLMRERCADEIGRTILARYRAPCLLCSEAAASHCHRRLVAEYWAGYLPGLAIVHL